MELIGTPTTVSVFRPIDLEPHPKNTYYFPTDSDDSDLEESIQARGIIDMPLVSDTNVIISGHRRVRIAAKLGFKQIQCQVRHYENEDMMLYDLLCSNILSRGGTAGLSSLYASRCIMELRRLYGNVGQRNRDLATSPIGIHKTVAEMAEELGMSRSAFGRAQTIMKVDEELAEKLDPHISGKMLCEVGTLSPEAQAAMKSELPANFDAAMVADMVQQLRAKDEEIRRLEAEGEEMGARLDRMTTKLSSMEEAGADHDLQDEIEKRLELEDKVREYKAQISSLRDQMRKQGKRLSEAESESKKAKEAGVQYVEVAPPDYDDIRKENEALRQQVGKLSQLNAIGEFARTNILSLQNITKTIDDTNVTQRVKAAEIALGDLLRYVQNATV